MTTATTSHSRAWTSFHSLLALLRHTRAAKTAFLCASVFSSLGMFAEISTTVLAISFLNVILTDWLPPESYTVWSFKISVPEIAWKSQTGAIFFFSASVGISSLVKNLFDLLGTQTAARFVFAAGAEIRGKAFDRLLTFGKPYFDETSSGDHYNRLLNLTQLLTYRLMELRNILSSVVMGLGYLVFLSVLSWRLTIVTCVVFVPLLWLLHRLRRESRRKSQTYTQTLGSLSQYLTDFVSNLPLIISFGKKDHEQRRFEEECATFSKAEYRVNQDAYLIGAVQESGSYLIMMFLGLLAYQFLVLTGSEASGRYIIFFVVLRRLKDAHYTITLAHSVLERLFGPVTTLLEIFDDKNKHYVPDGVCQFLGLHSEIEFRNTSFAYQEGPPALDHVSLRIKKGTTVALVGSSGSGKSTVLSLLQRLYDCPPGSIFFDGVDIRNFQAESVRKKISVVSQDVFLFNLSIRENLAYGLNRSVSDLEWKSLLAKCQLTEFVARLPHGLDTVIGDRGVQLSGGEKQRLSIARALLKDSEIVLLDEATSALETEAERAIQASLQELHFHRTVIVISHRLSSILHVDHVVLLEKGKVVEFGSPQELLARGGRFFELYTFQSIDSPQQKTGTSGT